MIKIPQEDRRFQANTSSFNLIEFVIKKKRAVIFQFDDFLRAERDIFCVPPPGKMVIIYI